MAYIIEFNSNNIREHTDKRELTPVGKEKALEMMQKCVKMLQDKIDAGDIEGLVFLMFSKDTPVMDYFAGSIKLTDLSFALQTMIHKIHSDSLMTMEENND